MGSDCTTIPSYAVEVQRIRTNLNDSGLTFLLSEGVFPTSGDTGTFPEKQRLNCMHLLMHTRQGQ